MSVGGGSAAGRGGELRGGAAAARAKRVATGKRGKAGVSETSLAREAKAWAAGAKGEARVAVHLDGLRVRGVRVFHDLLLDPAKAYNLDHLVVSAANVYNVDAKNWRGTLTVYQGRLWRHWYAGPKQGRQSEAMDKEIAKVGWMAGRASERLGHLVVPVIVLAGRESRGFTGVACVSGVYVLSVDTVNGWIRNAVPVMDPGQVSALGELVRLTFPPAVAARPSSGLGDAARTTGFLPPKAP